ncbi:helix-turn-helix transcriptional regulator [Belnapia sp. T18]|uniref:Helix-turn-helix transcriptional regulator n=2 Tax=Belnapia arida TaxID=2804533 RepID=A0ABS1UF10_9PROT|nr:helix-turn-helix transcriptional regulator [Belnapia arida]
MSASRNDTSYAISAGQVRAARALVGLTREQLAQASGVPMRTVARMELDEGTPQRRTLDAIRAALEAAGVDFIAENGGGAGVRLRRSSSPADATAPAAFAETTVTALDALPTKAAEDTEKR